MKRRIICLGLIVLLIFSLCSCKKNKADNEIRAVDFSDYTVEDVIAWANENNVITKFEFEYVKNAEKEPDSVISQSVESGKPITGKIVITAVEKEIFNVVTAPSDGIVSDSVSEGAELIKIPNVIGLSYSVAKDQLTSLGFQLDVKYASSAKEKDTVTLSDPLPDSMVHPGSKVLLTLSAGQKETRLSVEVDFEKFADVQKNVKFYVDGEIVMSMTCVVPESVKTKTFYFYGKGTKNLKVKVNNEDFANYVLDFDNKKVVKK